MEILPIPLCINSILLLTKYKKGLFLLAEYTPKHLLSVLICFDTIILCSVNLPNGTLNVNEYHRSKNTVNIIMKNMLDILVGGVMYWVCGWALAHGSGGTAFSGGGNFFTKNLPAEMYPIFFFDYMFASTAITIVSGSIAERCPILAYMVYSVVISGKSNLLLYK